MINDPVRRRVLIFHRRILTGLSGDDHDNQGDVDGDDSDVLKLVESVPPVCQI